MIINDDRGYMTSLNIAIQGFEAPLVCNYYKILKIKKQKSNIYHYEFIDLDYIPNNMKDFKEFYDEFVIPVYNKKTNEEKTQLLINTLKQVHEDKSNDIMTIKLSKNDYIIVDCTEMKYTKVWVKNEYIEKIKKYCESNRVIENYFELDLTNLKQSNIKIRLRYINDFLKQANFEYIEFDIFKLRFYLQ